ncbi:MAG: ATP-binding cassette domain-containing protein, partial [Actinobacteria bacterium]
IEVKNIEKTYRLRGRRYIEAVGGISFEVEEGETFGFLGPNGAGKTTTIGVLTTRVKADSGTAFIDGTDIKKKVELKRKIAVVPQMLTLDRSLTARENLLFHAKYFGVKKEEREKQADDLLEWFGLKDRSDDFVRSFSGGMSQRLMIARALMHKPKVLFLDEATTGLDPQSRRLLWDKIRDLNKNGQTIFLTTHYMEEADVLCNRVAIIDKGKVLAIDKPAKLKKMIPSLNIIEAEVSEYKKEFVTDLKKLNIDDLRIDDGKLSLSAQDGKPLVQQVVNIATKYDLEVRSIQLHTPTLEDVFIHLTGRGLRN